ncbi:hypothetical protein [Actinophytocola gossypii]|uniref:Lipoprotein n=1 Tax=Actinophytocola gossypii TaxID=2812003 RepID=A0ABT2J350_9PSEU|nr:hypothetical protein [Actinophytocola gossypii]MCT2582283.1 hypothetical protein [Actinophytocola gossypii]
MKRILAGLCLLAAVATGGCASTGDGADDVASADGTSTETTARSEQHTANMSEEEKALAFAKCMRNNGVPDFEDPGPGGGMKIEGERSRDDAGKAEAMKKATEKCREYSPAGSGGSGPSEKEIEQLRKFAKCMRENGLPDFPDPRADGQIGMKTNSGIDPASEEFKAAEQKCVQFQTRPGGGR